MSTRASKRRKTSSSSSSSSSSRSSSSSTEPAGVNLAAIDGDAQGLYLFGPAAASLFASEELMDGTVKIGDQSFEVCRFACASASEFFRGAFTSSMREGVDQAVVLSGDTSPIEVEALLRFAHTGGTELWVTDDRLDETYMAADQVVN